MRGRAEGAVLVQARLSVDGPAAGSVALWDWLRSERDLRGLVSQEPPPATAPGAMGAVSEVVVALSSSGTAAVLARSVKVWLIQRHRDITLTLTGPNGQTVSIDARRVDACEVEQLLRATLDVHQAASPPAPTSGQPRSAQQPPAEASPGSQGTS